MTLAFGYEVNHPEHMKWTKHWYDAVCPVFAEEQLTRKKSGEKGIIMVQLENEYIYFGMESEKKKRCCATWQLIARTMELRYRCLPVLHLR